MAQVHTLLSVGGYRVEEDTGLVFDERQVYAERTQTIVFRGSLQQLFATFKFGAASEVPDSQSKMYCAGPRSISQIRGTKHDPHWRASISWIGLHSYIHALKDYVFRLTPLWAARETEFPHTYNGESTGIDAVLAPAPFIPSGVVALAPKTPCVIHDHIPGYQVEGVMFSTVAPYPSHPGITSLIATLGTPSTADMVDYSGNVVAGYNWCKGMPESTDLGAKPGIGKWFPGSIQSNRVIEPMTGSGSSSSRLYQVSFPIQWLPRKSPV